MRSATETSRPSILRTPLIVLALCDLVLLGARLWPPPNFMTLGTTSMDPAITLAAYVGLAFWIGTARETDSRKALLSSALLGMLAGLLLIAQVVLATRQAADDPAAGLDRVQIGLLVCGAFVLGTTGLRTARAGFPTGFSTVCAIWASMMACLMAVAAVLSEAWLVSGQGESSDPWKDYQSLAIGSPAMQSLVRSLDLTAAFLLIGPIVGGISGAVFASFGRPKKG
jgi:hypothetical protein